MTKLTLVLGFILAGCAAPTIYAGPGMSSAAFGTPTSMSVSILVDAAPEVAFRMFANAEFPLVSILQTTGTVPGVTGTTLLSSAWGKPGALRDVHLTDGNTVHEQITHVLAPYYFAYRVWDLPAPLKNRVDHARGEWWFEPAGKQTRIVWQYTMLTTSSTARPLIALFLHAHFRAYMTASLERTKRQIEARAH